MFRSILRFQNIYHFTWFLVEENEGLTGRNGTVVVSRTRALWFCVASQTEGKNLKQVKDCQVYPTRSKTNPLIELVKATGNVQQELWQQEKGGALSPKFQLLFNFIFLHYRTNGLHFAQHILLGCTWTSLKSL